MLSHTFAVCAYKDSPYLEACIRSLKRQTVPGNIILCTSTPSLYLEAMAQKYNIPLLVRQGESDILEDWNFAYQQADAHLVTIVHQDDEYHRDYGKYVQRCWEKYPDTSVFSSDCVVRKNGKLETGGVVQQVKKLLRLPLRFKSLSCKSWIKQAALVMGNPIICPSCTYNKEILEMPLFRSSYKFALDWDTMWRLAKLPGRFVCEEKPLICYRIHSGATTTACIQNHRRYEEELAMYQKIWPKPAARMLMVFYQKAYGAYESCGGYKKE